MLNEILLGKVPKSFLVVCLALYGLYLVTGISEIWEQDQEKVFSTHFVNCEKQMLIPSSARMDDCDEFYLKGLPALPQGVSAGDGQIYLLSIDMIRKTYRSVQMIRESRNLNPYPPLEQLSHGIINS